MPYSEFTQTALKAKKDKGLSWDDLAQAAGAHKVFVASVIMGQNSMVPEMAEKTAAALGLGPEAVEAMTTCPMKGSLDQTVVADPLIYRFHEITQVYGTTMKEVVHEMFGDGIMSAIDFSIDIKKEENPKGDRVVIIYNGKFLPYKKW